MGDGNNGRPAAEWVGLGLHFEDWTMGRRLRTVGRTITEADITAFVGVTGMTEVLFTDVDYLENHSNFDRRLSPGALVYSMAEGLLIQSTIQGTGVAFLDAEMSVKGPTFAGDTIHVECEVVERRQTSKPERGYVKTFNTVMNQKGEVVMTYTPARLILTKAAGLAGS